MTPRLSYQGFKLMLIEWQDATTDHGWESTTEELSTCNITSIGWCISETDKAYVLAGDINGVKDDTETNRRIAIPKDWVVHVRKLK